MEGGRCTELGTLGGSGRDGAEGRGMIPAQDEPEFDMWVASLKEADGNPRKLRQELVGWQN